MACVGKHGDAVPAAGPSLATLTSTTREETTPANDGVSSTQGVSIEKPDEQQARLSPKIWLAFSSVAITNLAAAFDATTLSVALPAISISLGGSTLEPFWAGTSYLLASTVMMLIWVSLSDVFGRRLTMLTTLAVFGIGSVICAVALNYTVFIAGRTVQGLGGGGLISLTTVLITDLVPLRERGKFYALGSVIWVLGSTTGPIIGGALAEGERWRWIFWLNLPVVGVGAVGIIAFLSLRRPDKRLVDGLMKLDYIGSGIFVVSVTVFLVPLTWGGVQYPWSSWHTILPLFLGAAGVASFGLYEALQAYYLRPTLVPMRIFRNYSASIVYFGSCVHGLILYCLLYYLPEYFQSVQGYSPIMSGVAALPQTTTVVPCAVVVGVVVAMTGRYRWAVWAGWILTTLGCGLLAMLDEKTTVPAWIFLEGVSGLGLGLLFPSTTLATQASISQTEVAIAATLVLFFRAFGQALGVATGAAILENRMRANLAALGVSQSPDPLAGDTHSFAATGAVALVEQLNALPRDSPLAIVLRAAFSRSFQTIWLVMCGLAGFCTLVHFLINEYDMAQAHQPEQVIAGPTRGHVEEGFALPATVHVLVKGARGSVLETSSWQSSSPSDSSDSLFSEDKTSSA